MARPHSTVEVVVIPLKLTLKRGIDDDLIALFQRTPRRRRSQAVMAALRGQAQSDGADAPTAEAEADTGFLADLGL